MPVEPAPPLREGGRRIRQWSKRESYQGMLFVLPALIVVHPKSGGELTAEEHEKQDA